MSGKRSFVCDCGATWTGCGAFKVEGQWQIEPSVVRDDNLLSPENLKIVAEFLEQSEDALTLQLLREIYPADVLRAASKQLPPEVFDRIKIWTIELNRIDRGAA